jgi:UDP-N-acetylglucosamine 1-carboxyvinyltransferase
LIASRAVNDVLRIEGGQPLSGRIRPAGNKNAALPILAACLLTDEEVVLENVPDILDVRSMLELLESLGVTIRQEGPQTISLKATNITTPRVDPEIASRIRASVLLTGPLLARCGVAELPAPGGDFIGRRRIDTHLHAFRALGVEVETGRDYRLHHNGLVGTEMFLDEASVTATENALAVAVVATGRTTILNAACEPHVQDMVDFLVTLGAKIEGSGTNRLIIDGVDRLHGGRFRIGPDHIEVASFIGLAAVTGSDLIIEPVRADDLRMINLTFARLGIRVDIEGESLHVAPNQELRVIADEGGAIPKIDDGVWPAFPADLTSIATAVATQVNGEVMIFEKMFENRLFFVDKLVAMGARIILCDPHRVVVSGRSQLYGARLESPDIRAGMAMLIAALAAKGVSTIGNIRQVDRGYERIDERLRAIGANIERVSVGS